MLENHTLNGTVSNFDTDNISTYSLDDFSSLENFATLENGAILVNDSTANYILELDGVDDYATVNNSQEINLATFSKKTITVSFKIDQLKPNAKQVIYEQGGTVRGLNIYLENDTLYVGGWNEPTTESGWKGTYLSTSGLLTDQWYQVALVLDANENDTSIQSNVFKAYLNGVKFGEGEGSQLWSHSGGVGIGGVNADSQFHDGDVKGTGINNFSGSIDKVQYYNQALTDQEILQLLPTKEPSTQNLIFNLDIEQVANNVIDDISNFSNDGFMKNGAMQMDDGNSNYILHLDGVDDYVTIDNSSEINVGTFNDKTISLSFKIDEFKSNEKQVLYEQGGTVRGLNIYLENDSLYVGGWNEPTTESGWSGTYLSTDGLLTNEWYHVALVLDSEEGNSSIQPQVLQGYLNGVKFGEGEGSQLWSHSGGIGVGGLNGDTQFHDGDAKGTGINNFSGSIDDIQSYNQALDTKEINYLAKSAFSRSSSSEDHDSMIIVKWVNIWLC